VTTLAASSSAAAGDPASLARAVELYRGDLCPEDPYGEALEPRRRELREIFADAALKLAQGAVERRDFETAIDATRRLLRVEPGEEQAHYFLMRALSGSGRKQDALRQFEVCARSLKETLAREPSASLVSFHRALEQSETSRARLGGPGTWQRAARRLLGTMHPAPLRGREGTLGEIEGFVRKGSGVLFILGEAGVGKTRLAVEGARLAQERGALVLSGAGSEFERLAPYALLIEAWSDHLRALEIPPRRIRFTGSFPIAPTRGGTREGSTNPFGTRSPRSPKAAPSTGSWTTFTWPIPRPSTSFISSPGPRGASR
jgi:hypothetical protein